MSYSNYLTLIFIFVVTTISCQTNNENVSILSNPRLKGFLNYELPNHAPQTKSIQVFYIKYDSLVATIGKENFDIKKQSARVLNGTISLKPSQFSEIFYRKNGSVEKTLSKRPARSNLKYKYTENEYVASIDYIGTTTGLIKEQSIFDYNVDTTICIEKHYFIKWIDTKLHKRFNGINPNINYELETDSLNTLSSINTYSMGIRGEKHIYEWYKSGVVADMKINEKDTINNVEYRLILFFNTSVPKGKKRKLNRVLFRRKQYIDNDKTLIYEEFIPKNSDDFLTELEKNNNNLYAFHLENKDMFLRTKNSISFLDTTNVTEKIYREKGEPIYSHLEYLFDEFGRKIVEYRVANETGKIEEFLFIKYISEDN